VDLKAFVKSALESGRTALTEAESKTILDRYGVPVVTETLPIPQTRRPRQLEMGFPIVLKGLVDGLLHKTESGLVHLNLADEQSVTIAADQILQAAPGAQLLVQPQITGGREFVAGLFRDPDFGPAILFGLGGILTEVLSDVVFRLAPLTRQDAVEMIESIRSRPLLGPFRGEKAVDREGALNTLMGLSAVAADFPEIAEIDINPLIATATGDLKAVDALITLVEPDRRATDAHPVPPPAIHSLFYPRSVAFIGASAQMGKWGHMLICNTISGGYQGKVYAVNPKGGMIAGKPVFKTIADIPEAVDLAVVTVPAAGIMDLIPN
jgi:acyl-CoA synthetase (NDP forming)